MKRLFFVLALFSFPLNIFAHGEEGLIVILPFFVLVVIFPPLIGSWDYKLLSNYLIRKKHTELGMQALNYLTIGLALLSFYLFGVFLNSDSLILTTSLLFFPLIIFQTIIKSLFYYILNIKKPFSVTKIIRLIFFRNVLVIVIAFILASLGYLLMGN